MKKAFTIVELMIVISIIAMICAITIPNSIKSDNSSTDQTNIKNEFRIKDGNKTYIVIKINLEGHTYMDIRNSDNINRIGFVHDPSCGCNKTNSIKVEKLEQ